jgi:hypothetical protein
MGTAEIETAGIGVDSERFFFETEVLRQHDANLQPAAVQQAPACARSREARAARRALDSCYLENPIY